MFETQILTRMDARGYIKRDFAAERSLKGHLKFKGVNLDLDAFSNEETMNQLSNRGMLSKNNASKHIMEIVKEAQRFIAQKSQYLRELFTFKDIPKKKEPFQQLPNGYEITMKDNSQINNLTQKNDEKYVNNKIKLIKECESQGVNESMNISTTVMQFMNEQKEQLRQKEEKKLNSLNQSFRSASNQAQRIPQTNVSTKNDSLQDKEKKLILLESRKQFHNSQRESNKNDLNKSYTIQFQAINNILENDEEYENLIPETRPTLTTCILENLNEIENSIEQQNASMNESADRNTSKSIISSELNEYQPNDGRKKIKLQIVSKINQKAREKQMWKDSTLSQMLANCSNKSISKQTEKYVAKLNSHKLEEVNIQSNSLLESQFLQSPDLLLSRESIFLTGAIDQNINKDYNKKIKSESDIFEQESTLFMQPRKINTLKRGEEVFSDSQSPCLSSSINQRPFYGYDEDDLSQSSIPHQTDDDSLSALMIFPNNAQSSNLSQQLFKKPLEKKQFDSVCNLQVCKQENNSQQTKNQIYLNQNEKLSDDNTAINAEKGGSQIQIPKFTQTPQEDTLQKQISNPDLNTSDKSALLQTISQPKDYLVVDSSNKQLLFGKQTEQSLSELIVQKTSEKNQDENNQNCQIELTEKQISENVLIKPVSELFKKEVNLFEKQIEFSNQSIQQNNEPASISNSNIDESSILPQIIQEQSKVLNQFTPEKKECKNTEQPNPPLPLKLFTTIPQQTEKIYQSLNDDNNNNSLTLNNIQNNNISIPNNTIATQSDNILLQTPQPKPESPNRMNPFGTSQTSPFGSSHNNPFSSAAVSVRPTSLNDLVSAKSHFNFQQAPTSHEPVIELFRQNTQISLFQNIQPFSQPQYTYNPNNEINNNFQAQNSMNESQYINGMTNNNGLNMFNNQYNNTNINIGFGLNSNVSTQYNSVINPQQSELNSCIDANTNNFFNQSYLGINQTPGGPINCGYGVTGNLNPMMQLNQGGFGQIAPINNFQQNINSASGMFGSTENTGMYQQNSLFGNQSIIQSSQSQHKKQKNTKQRI